MLSFHEAVALYKTTLHFSFSCFSCNCPAIAPAILLKGKGVIDDPVALGIATETTVFKHLFARSNEQNVRFTYWHGKQDREVDFVAQIDQQLIPFEVKYRAKNTDSRDLKGMIQLCEQKKINRGYVVTKALNDFGVMNGLNAKNGFSAQIMRVPAPLLCYWMGAAESEKEATLFL